MQLMTLDDCKKKHEKSLAPHLGPRRFSTAAVKSCASLRHCTLQHSPLDCRVALRSYTCSCRRHGVPMATLSVLRQGQSSRRQQQQRGQYSDGRPEESGRMQ